MTLWLPIPASDYIKVKTFNKLGKELCHKDFEDNPRLSEKYPSKEEVQRTYVSVLNQVNKTGKHHLITVTEQGINITVQDNA